MRHPSKIFTFGSLVLEENKSKMRKIPKPALKNTGTHNSYLCTTTTNRVTGGFSQHARCAHQVHGGAAWRMWLNKQLRWRLSKVLDLCLCGLQERERGKGGERGGGAVTINMHQSDGSMRYLTMQANPNSAMALLEGGWGEATGERGALPIPLVLPLPPSACRVIQVLVWKRQAFSY